VLERGYVCGFVSMELRICFSSGIMLSINLGQNVHDLFQDLESLCGCIIRL
jgi:hypothetical protein